jgi:hypothetical protein
MIQSIGLILKGVILMSIGFSILGLMGVIILSILAALAKVIF